MKNVALELPEIFSGLFFLTSQKQSIFS